MESLSRPFHRRKLSNVASFSAKNAYDGVLSGHRKTHAGASDANVEDYREIFGSSQAASSIPVLDLSALEDSSGGSNSEFRSSKPDYSNIFGSFRDEDIAVSYEQLFARDKARASSSASPASQDSDDLSPQSSDALKQFNMSYHKISQRSKDGLDGTTHVAKLHAIPGFTCFIDETAPLQKEAEKQKSAVVNNVHPSVDSRKGDFSMKQTSGSGVISRSKHRRDESLSDDKVYEKVEINLKSHPSAVASSSASQTNVDGLGDYQKKSTSLNSGIYKSNTSESAPGDGKKKSTSINCGTSKSNTSESASGDSHGDYQKKPTSITSGTFQSSTSESAPGDSHGDHQKKSTFINSGTSKSNSSENAAADSHGDYQKKSTSMTSGISKNNTSESVPGDSHGNYQKKSTSINPGTFKSNTSKSAPGDSHGDHQKKSTSINCGTSKSNISESAPGYSHGDYQKKSTSINAGTSNSNTSENASGEFSPTYFDEELDVNSTAAASAAALKKAIESAQECIRIAKESVVRKEGLRSFSNRSFKDSLKVKGRPEYATAGEEQKEKDNNMKGTFEGVGAASQVFPITGRNHKYRGKVVSPYFTDGEKLFVGKKVIDEIHGKIAESSNKQCEIPICSHEFGDDKIVCHPPKVVGEREARSLDSASKYEYASGSSEAVDTGKSRNVISAFKQADLGNNMMTSDDYEGKANVTKAANGNLEHQRAVKEFKLVEKACELEYAGKGDTTRIAEEGEGEVDKIETACLLHERRENDTYEAPHEDGASAQRPEGFLVHESCEKKLGEIEDTTEDDKSLESEETKVEVRPSNAHILEKELNNLTLSLEVEDEKKIPQGSNQHDHQTSSNEAVRLLENEKQEVSEQEHVENVENAERHEWNSNDEGSEKGLEEAFPCLENELKENHSAESHKVEDISEKFYDVLELEMIENAQTSAYSRGKSEVSLEEHCEMKQKENHNEEVWKRLGEVYEQEIDENSSSDYDDAEESESVHSSHGTSNIVIDTQDACNVDINDSAVGTSQEVDDDSSSSEQVTGASCEFHVETPEAMYGLEEKEIFGRTSVDQTASEDHEDECEVKADNLENGLAGVDIGQNENEENDVRSESSSDTMQGTEIEADKSNDEIDITEEEKLSFMVEEESNLQQSHEERTRVVGKQETGASQEPKVENDNEKTMDGNEDIKTSQYKEKKDGIRESGPSKLAGKDHQGRIEEVTEKEREREKNRLAVERVIREARERAFAEVRERAERAAVERANAEVRQRVLSDAQEKVAKASVGTNSSSDRTAQSKLRAERAAVERATAEARQRALEKAMSQKNTSETSAQANGIRKSASSSDLPSSIEAGAESAQRSKAKFEKHNRIMERAAKALAEKEKRDLLAQKEQTERNRLAEGLDADIKRWSSGKEGNLRALLSTLQYILGSDSGWQPVSLTDIITSSAVKKAYRKATLCVHPDKLQQRGASIQQKYICEKVFDLLKAAWTRFDSEER